MGKTIKQVADELGVSKTAVNKKIDKLGLRNKLLKNGNRLEMSESIENSIKSEFKSNQNSDTSAQTNAETVSSLIGIFKEQLEVKDQQIAELQKLIDQEQQLRMVTEQKLLAIEEQDKTPKHWWNLRRK